MKKILGGDEKEAEKFISLPLFCAVNKIKKYIVAFAFFMTQTSS